ncbi:peptidoglycan -binding protein [Pseudomonadota bacterium]
MMLTNRRRRALDIWPGFVDALAALLMVVIFVLLLFSLGQFLLSDALLGRDEAIDQLRGQMRGLANVLSQERKDKDSLESELTGVNKALESSLLSEDDLRQRLSLMTLEARETEVALAALQVELDTSRTQLSEQLQLVAQRTETVSSLEAERDQLEESLQDSEQKVIQARDSSAELGVRLEALNEQLMRLNSALSVSESELKDKNLEVEDLGQRLNTALAGKVEELAVYRSEFFGKLRESLRDNADIRVEGDRFVLPSEVLFSSASATLDVEGQHEIAAVARTLKSIAAQIPDDIDWVLRIDGHTDRRPVRKAFPSNWELSSARATSIVKYLVEQGIPPHRLVAAGFAQYHPLDKGDTAEAYRRNRRIEFKLTSR